MIDNYKVPPRQQAMRPDLVKQRLVRSVVDTLYIIIGLLLLLAIYGWVGAMDAQAEIAAKLDHTEKNFSRLLSREVITVDGQKDAIKCTDVIYEKGN